MSSEKMLPSVAYKKEPLLDDVEMSVPQGQRMRTTGIAKRWLVILIIGGLVAMALMFLGGFYTGRHKEDHRRPPPPQQVQSYTITSGDGSSLQATALNGNQPAEDFIQCRTVSVDGSGVCMPSNPIVTAKGSLQLTLYQYNGQASLIVSGSGDNYGEHTDGSTRVARDTSSTKNRQVRLHVENFHGDVSHPTVDSYHRAFGMQHYSEPSKISTNMSWNHLGSHALILHMNKTNSKPVKVYFEHNYTNAGNRLPGLFLGGKNLSHSEFNDLPTASKPLLLSLGPVISSEYYDDDSDDYDQPHDKEVTNDKSAYRRFYIFIETILFIRKNTVRDVRSTSEPEKTDNGLFFKLFDKQNPEKALSTIRVIHDRRHGGRNGTVMFDVTNHTSRCRAQFSTLYHNFLSDGKELENTTHHQTYIYHRLNASGHHLAMWQAVTPFNNAEGSTVRPLVGQVPSDLPCIGDELRQLRDRLKSIIDDPSSVGTGRKLLSWSCGFMDTLDGGYHCASDGYNCYSGVRNSHWKLSALWNAGKTCIGAGQSCYGLYHKCWN